MENENFDIVAAVKQLVEDYGHLANEIAEVKASIYDNLLNPIKEEFDHMQYEDALSDFRCKHAEKLEPFNDKLKALEKDDSFDIVKKAFDDFSGRKDGMEEDVYVDKLASKIQEQLDDIAGIFGVKPEEIEEVKVETDEGEVKAGVEDGEVTSVEKENEETAEEKPAEEAPVSEEEVEKVEEETPAEEVEERSEFATDTPDDDEENLKFWEEEMKKVR
jgi:hypothetical protein